MVVTVMTVRVEVGVTACSDILRCDITLTLLCNEFVNTSVFVFFLVV